MADARNTRGAPPADTAASLREREHAIRNELFALTLRSDLAREEVARRRDELNRQLAHARELLARSEAWVRRAGHRHGATLAVVALDDSDELLRLLILAVLAKAGRPLDPEEIAERVAAMLGVRQLVPERGH